MQATETAYPWKCQYDANLAADEAPYLTCTANYACRNEARQEAIYVCTQCASLQCSKCEVELHRTTSAQSRHQRLKIDDLDDGPYCSMNSKHQATIVCQQCKDKFCKKCFDKQHQQTDKRYHKSMKYQDDLRYKTEIRTMKVPSSTNEQHDDAFQDIDVSGSDNSLNSQQHSFNSANSNQSPKENHINKQMLSDSLSENQDNELDEVKSFLLLDGQEKLNVDNKWEFLRKLNVGERDTSVKCVSIVGNTGDGKSYTLNQIFFNGKDVFRTSSASDSCTMGVWSSLDENQTTLVLDTEGLLGQTTNSKSRNRLLLKVMCLSDIIIYRIRAPRLTNDMFEFLSEASRAFAEYFQKELQSVMKTCNFNGLKSLPGPTLVIFHETQYTDVLGEDFENRKTPVQQIKERFESMELDYSSYPLMEYVGVRTSGGEKTDFRLIKSTVTSILEDKNIRPPRPLSVFYAALKALNEKFSHDIPPSLPSTLLNDFFACSNKCLACGSKCSIVANHQKDNLAHHCENKCVYNPDVDNEIWKCRACLREKIHTTVYGKLITKNDGLFQGLIRYVWSGFVIECPKHGEIYRSRKYWYGNSNPKDVTQVEVVHVWEGEKNIRDTSDVTPRKCMEMLMTAGSYLAAPTKMITETLADQVAPSYWVPNKDAKQCAKVTCRLEFGSDYSKHHCRSCGQVFCDTCSKKRCIVPWVDAENPVRVCDECADKPKTRPPPSIVSSSDQTDPSTSRIQSNGNSNSSDSDTVEIPTTRRVYDTFVTGLGRINANYPLELIMNSTRPNYWQPDDKCLACIVCKTPFNNTTNRLHHCRNCGFGVCATCSPYKRCVPERDWLTPVRICKHCNETLGEENQ